MDEIGCSFSISVSGKVYTISGSDGAGMEKSGLEPTREFYDLWLKTYKATTGRLVEMPAMGPAREKSEKFMKGFSAYINLYTAGMDSSSNIKTVLLEAMRRMHEKTGSEMKGEISPEKYKDFCRIWIETYSEIFKEFSKPLLNVMVEFDHLVPTDASKPLNGAVSSSDKETFVFPTGHIGIFVDSKSQKEVCPRIAEWLKPRSLQDRTEEKPEPSKKIARTKRKESHIKGE